MKFLCLVYFEPAATAALSAGERTTLGHDSMAYDKQLGASGHYIVAEALQPVTTARTIRVRRGKTSSSDGPFAETKEQLGGFILINARDMDEALKIAAGIPLAKFGSIGVRPVMQFD